MHMLKIFLMCFGLSFAGILMSEAMANSYDGIALETKKQFGDTRNNTERQQEAALYYVFKCAELNYANQYRGWKPDPQTGTNKDWEQMIKSPLTSNPKIAPAFKPSNRSNAVNIAATFLNMHEHLLNKDPLKDFAEIVDNSNGYLCGMLYNSLEIVAGNIVPLSTTTVATPEEATVYVKAAYLKGIELAALVSRNGNIYGTVLSVDTLDSIYNFSQYLCDYEGSSFVHCFMLAVITQMSYIAATGVEDNFAFIKLPEQLVPERKQFDLFLGAQRYLVRFLEDNGLDAAILRTKYDDLFSNPIDNSKDFGEEKETHQFVAYKGDVHNLNHNRVLRPVGVLTKDGELDIEKYAQVLHAFGLWSRGLEDTTAIAKILQSRGYVVAKDFAATLDALLFDYQIRWQIAESEKKAAAQQRQASYDELVHLHTQRRNLEQFMTALEKGAVTRANAAPAGSGANPNKRISAYYFLNNLRTQCVARLRKQGFNSEYLTDEVLDIKIKADQLKQYKNESELIASIMGDLNAMVSPVPTPNPFQSQEDPSLPPPDTAATKRLKEAELRQKRLQRFT